jgi:hypothetical protein
MSVSDKANLKRVFAYARAQQNVNVSISALKDKIDHWLEASLQSTFLQFECVFIRPNRGDIMALSTRRPNGLDLVDREISIEKTITQLKNLIRTNR